LNAQGRILADAYVYDFSDSMLLDTEPETATKLSEHLDKYIIADDVALEDETGQWTTFGVEGPESIALATDLGIAVPEKKYHWLQFGSGFVARAASSTPDGLRIFSPRDEQGTILHKFEAAGIPQASAQEARIVRLENGIPRYGDDITERFLVQETQALHGVHFTKGCYLGQEIVERVRSRGQVHRLLTPIRIKGSSAVPPGTKFTAEGVNAAEVTSAVYSPALDEVVGLAYARTEALHHKPPLVAADSSSVIEAYLP
jgi:tRNA-modifying protein YgfZ